ncbi:hypothetical protein [Terracidiphilus gabretensis]|uniref:hypothetical protein n=1 Tax=Terracidiphilus gabretensis TaxID=1577687 RepID=UPI00071BEA4E|nr:hypothetical protein [Terracidiphilus gabretensis]
MTASVSVERSTLSLALNVLNEVLHGFSNDFSAIGTTRDDVRGLFEKLKSLDKPGEDGAWELSADEAGVLSRCTAVCLKEIDEDEFFTRVGVSSDVARQFIESLGGWPRS